MSRGTGAFRWQKRKIFVVNPSRYAVDKKGLDSDDGLDRTA